MDSTIGHSQHFHQRYLPSTSSEMDTIFKMIPSNNGWNNSEPLQELGGKAGETVGLKQHNGCSYGGSELIYQGFSNGPSTAAGNGFYGSENFTQSEIGIRNSSNLIRQKSSPAGFFSNENGLPTLKEIGSFKASDVSNRQVTATTRGLHSNLTFSTRPPSFLKWMPQIAENGNKSLEENCDKNRHLINGNGSSKSYLPSFISESWDNSAFNSTNTEREDEIMFSTTNGLESQVRRTRISDRIKKLEGFFPKSDKQTSTADMLDSVVEYIKDLEELVQILVGHKEKCKCT